MFCWKEEEDGLTKRTFKVAFSSFSKINQSACSTLDWVLKSQSDFDGVLDKHHWEFPIHEKTTTDFIIFAAVWQINLKISEIRFDVQFEVHMID